MIDQPLLFADERQTAFEKYHEENPQIYEGFKKFTFEAIRAGAKHLGARAVFERMRWESSITGNDGYKCNNLYPAYYSRLFAKDFPEHADFFRFRTAKADEEI